MNSYIIFSFHEFIINFMHLPPFIRHKKYQSAFWNQILCLFLNALPVLWIKPNKQTNKKKVFQILRLIK